MRREINTDLFREDVHRIQKSEDRNFASGTLGASGGAVVYVRRSVILNGEEFFTNINGDVVVTDEPTSLNVIGVRVKGNKLYIEDFPNRPDWNKAQLVGFVK